MASASELQKGKYFEYRGEILQVVRKEIVAYGTHSHSKLKITAEDLHGKGQKTFTLAHEDKVDILDIRKKTATIIAKLQDKVQIMDPISFETLDASISPELFNEVKEGDEVIFIDYNNNVTILEKGR